MPADATGSARATAQAQAGAAKLADATVAELGEFGLIDAVTARLPQGEAALLGPGDDAAVLAARDGRVVVTTDLLVEGQHFRRDWSSAYDVGRKAAAQNLADVAAMGAMPTAIVVGLAAGGQLPAAWALEFADGLRDECAQVGAFVAGGDVVRSPELVIVSVTALGALEGRAPLTRSGARAGDVVAVAGRLGWAAAGLAVLRRGFRSPRVLVDAHRRPQPPYEAGPEAARLGGTALVDVSDGLVQDLGHIARASGVRITVDSSTLAVDEPLRNTAAALGGNPMDWVLQGGEDHALAGTFPPGTDLPARWKVIGKVAALPEPGESPSESAAAVLVDGQPWEGSGFDHFRSS